jgi:hypothetical protein
MGDWRDLRYPGSCGDAVRYCDPMLLRPASFSVEELSERLKANNDFRIH